MFNLMHLKFFYDAVRLQSVTQAAKQNFVSQSALSQGIQKLELDLQAELIIHQKNRFRTTDAGRVVFEHAQKLFAGIEQMKEELQGDQIAGTITFACTNSIARALVPKALLKTKELYPNLKVNFHRGSVRFIKESLKNGSVDFAIIVDDPQFAAFDKVVIKKGEFGIFTMGKKSPVYIDHRESRETAHFIKNDPKLKLGDELSGWGMVEEFIKQGLGAGILPDFMKAQGMKRVKAKGAGLEYEIVALFSKGVPLSKGARVFLASSQKTEGMLSRCSLRIS